MSDTLPRYNINSILRMRGCLLDEVFRPFFDCAIVGGSFRSLVAAVSRRMKAQPDVIFSSLTNLLGCKLTEQTAKDTAWRLAGNRTRLQRGLAVPPWNVQKYAEWVPVEIRSWEAARKRGKYGGNYVFVILAGTSCSLKIRVFWSSAVSQYVSRMVGYTSNKRSYPIHHPSELVRMRLLSLIEPRLSFDFPSFWKVTAASYLNRHNLRIIQLRRRRAGKYIISCPSGFSWPCYQCPAGYNDCYAAVHENTKNICKGTDNVASQKAESGAG